jgi:hypothetical protein
VLPEHCSDFFNPKTTQCSTLSSAAQLQRFRYPRLPHLFFADNYVLKISGNLALGNTFAPFLWSFDCLPLQPAIALEILRDHLIGPLFKISCCALECVQTTSNSTTLLTSIKSSLRAEPRNSLFRAPPSNFTVLYRELMSLPAAQHDAVSFPATQPLLASNNNNNNNNNNTSSSTAIAAAQSAQPRTNTKRVVNVPALQTFTDTLPLPSPTPVAVVTSGASRRDTTAARSETAAAAITTSANEPSKSSAPPPPPPPSVNQAGRAMSALSSLQHTQPLYDPGTILISPQQNVAVVAPPSTTRNFPPAAPSQPTQALAVHELEQIKKRRNDSELMQAKEEKKKKSKIRL